MRKTIPLALRGVGESSETTIKLRWSYAMVLYQDGAIREAVTTLEETARTAQRALGSAHPTTVGIEMSLRFEREALRARETLPTTV